MKLVTKGQKELAANPFRMSTTIANINSIKLELRRIDPLTPRKDYQIRFDKFYIDKFPGYLENISDESIREYLRNEVLILGVDMLRYVNRRSHIDSHINRLVDYIDDYLKAFDYHY